MSSAVLAVGYWGQNIGNAFFQLGGSALLKRALGAENVAFVQDVPAHWTLHRKRRGNPEQWWNIVSKVRADYVVFQGPSLDRFSNEALDATFRELSRRGVEPVLLGVGLKTYADDEAELARRLIDRHRVRVVATRDRSTFDALAGRASYDGIDSAFFLPWAVRPASLHTSKYVALSFERMIEPSAQILQVLAGEQIAIGHSTRALSLAGAANAMAQRSHAAAYLVHSVWPRQHRRAYGDYSVVRLVHRTNPAHIAKIYRNANTVASDEPYTYITTYAAASFTFSDRVHACVVALAFGRPAMMWFATPRNGLLERVGVVLPMAAPTALSVSVLEQERAAELHYLRQALA